MGYKIIYNLVLPSASSKITACSQHLSLWRWYSADTHHLLVQWRWCFRGAGIPGTRAFSWTALIEMHGRQVENRYFIRPMAEESVRIWRKILLMWSAYIREDGPRANIEITVHAVIVKQELLSAPPLKAKIEVLMQNCNSRDQAISKLF